MDIRSSAEVLIQKIDKIIDVGDSEQIKLYTDMISEQNFNLKINLLIQLSTLLLQNNIKYSGFEEMSNQNKRLINYIDKLLLIFKCLGLNKNTDINKLKNYKNAKLDEMLNEISLKIDKDIKKLINDNKELQINEGEINRLMIFIKDIRKIKYSVENCEDIKELKLFWEEICLLFESICLINDFLISSKYKSDKACPPTEIKMGSSNTKKQYIEDNKKIRNNLKGQK